MTTTTRRLRALIAALVLIVLIVGVPLLLLTVAGSPIPESLPTIDDIRDTLSRPDYTGSVVMGILLFVAWIGWALFTASVLLEIPAQLRGVHAPRLRGLALPQRAAAGLVAAVVAGMTLAPSVATATPAAAHATEPAATAVSVTAAAEPTSTTSANTESAPAPSAAPLPPQNITYTVQRGDSLWSIAEDHLGDGERWREIVELNVEREQPGGHRLSPEGSWIDPGWVLELPILAAVAEVPIAAAPPAREAVEHVVAPGESLWSIAETYLGDGEQWPAVHEASQSIDQGSGQHLDDPSLIRPGWTVIIPGAGVQPATEPAAQPPAGTPAEPAAASAADPSTAVDGVGDDERAAIATDEQLPGELDQAGGASDTRQTTPRDLAVQDPTGTSAPESVPVAERPMGGEEIDTDTHVDSEDDDAQAPARMVAGIGGLLAVGVLGLVTAKRAATRRRRRPGERTPMPDPDSGVSVLEEQLRATADPLGIDTVDRALRALATHHRGAGTPLPDVRAAKLTEDRFSVYLEGPADLPAPWTSRDASRMVWSITAEDAGQIQRGDIDDSTAPYPTLVTIGLDDADAYTMLDLERIDTLSVRGDQAAAHATLAALALELATTPWADHIQVTLVSTLHDLGDVVDTGRIRHVHGLTNVLRELEQRADAVEAALERAGASSVTDARGRGADADDTWTPEVLLIGENLDPTARAALERLVTRVPRVGIAAVTTQDELGDWVLDLSEDPTRAVLHPANVSLRPQQVDEATYRAALELLRDREPQPGPDWGQHLDQPETALADLPVPAPPATTAGQEPPEIDETHTPASSDEEAGARPADVVVLHPPAVRVLGPVEVDVTSGVSMSPNHRRQATELIAYLALHPGGDGKRLSAALWPTREPKASTRVPAVSRARSWLGTDADGAPYLPLVTDGAGYSVNIPTDWHEFLALVGNDASTAPLSDLKKALTLVRGRPFADAPSTRYVWAEGDIQEMLSAVVDVAHEVARRALDVGDAATARWAASVGRLVDPADERTWRDGIRAEWVAGRVEEINRLVDQLHHLLSDLETDAEPETDELIAQVEVLTTRRAAHGGTR